MMRDELLLYYERELRFIRKLAGEFADKYPEVAGRLLLEPTKCEDPHVERLIEAFAMLAARVHLRIDDDFPEITDALLGILYPHYLAPVPSMTVVQMTLDPAQGGAAGGVLVDRHTSLLARPVDGVRCRFRTAYPVRLFPLEVAATEITSSTHVGAQAPGNARSALKIRLRTLDGKPVSELELDTLTFFLDAESGSLHRLYELFFRDAVGVFARRGAKGRGVLLGADRIRPLGFERREGLLEYPLESFLGYRMLQEYFAFPEKYLFVELSGLSALKGESKESELELSVLLDRSLAEMDLRVTPENLKLGCTPAVNLFPQRADPIRLAQTTIEYRVTPDVRFPYSYEVYGVEEVASTSPGSSESKVFHPFYALRHGMASAQEVAFWSASRRPSLRRNDPGTEVYLTLVDGSFHPTTPPVDVLHVRALCTNRDLPARLPFGDPTGDFQIEGRSDVERVTCLRKPTQPTRAPAREDSRWRLVSHLALNHLSIAQAIHEQAAGAAGENATGLAALREILKLYDFEDSAVTRQRIEGLVGLRSKKVLRRVGRGDQGGFARGVEVELEFDESKYTGSGVFLFASVLERFLGLYTAVNSFTQTAAVVRQRGGVMKKWPPRAGEVQLL